MLYRYEKCIFLPIVISNVKNNVMKYLHIFEDEKEIIK